ncbi:MAG: hypothetical protein E7170_01435 [Firmicutes bacterium]|nr:hypothetical protein [Bacillota bacterium]
MNINYEKIKEIYGEELLEYIKEDSSIVVENIKHLIFLEFNDVEDIFERYAPLFLEYEFKNKINSLIKKIGPDYVDMIENDLGLLEELL